MRAADVMQRPTARGLARIGDGDEEGAVALPPLERTVDGSRLESCTHPVSWNQSQLLTVHVVDGATAAYNIPMAHWLDGGGAARPASMRRALGRVAERERGRERERVEDEGDGGGRRARAPDVSGGRARGHFT